MTNRKIRGDVMGILDKLKELKEQAAQFILEPERLDALAGHLNECGLQAEVECQAKLEDVHVTRGESGSSFAPFCIGRIRLYDSPLDHIEIIKSSGSSSTSVDVIGARERTRTKMNYEDHFIIDVPGHELVGVPRAKRKAKRALWIVGKIIEYRWRGGRFAEDLAGDASLNRMLAASGEGKIIVRYDRSGNCIRIVRPYVGMTIDMKSGLIRHDWKIDTQYNFPSREALTAYASIALHARAYAALSRT